MGNAPIVEATVGGVTIRFLVDTGSQVTTITEAFYRKHLATGNDLHNPNNWLIVLAANGLSVPYIGYLELYIEVCGVCRLLGTNVLSHVPAISEAFRLARVAGCRPIFVPAHSTMDIPAIGHCGSGTAIMEPLYTAFAGNLFTLNTLVESDSFVVKVVNNSSTGVNLNPGTRIGLLCSATVCISAKVVDGGVEHLRTTREEPYVDVLASLDLSSLEDSPAPRYKARAMFQKHVDVFASSEDDLGCTDADKPRIWTTDTRPVTQPYRRVPPT